MSFDSESTCWYASSPIAIAWLSGIKLNDLRPVTGTVAQPARKTTKRIQFTERTSTPPCFRRVCPVSSTCPARRGLAPTVCYTPAGLGDRRSSGLALSIRRSGSLGMRARPRSAAPAFVWRKQLLLQRLGPLRPDSYEVRRIRGGSPLRRARRAQRACRLDKGRTELPG